MAQSVLIVVDLQKGFVTEHSSHLVDPIAHIQYEFDTVICTKFYNPSPSPFREILDYHKLVPHSDETKLAFPPRSDAILIERSLYTCVTAALKKHLRDLQAPEVHICGIASEACVLKTALDLFEHGICPLILKDLCASDQDARYHEMAMELLSKLVGKDHVLHSEDSIRRIHACKEGLVSA